MADRVETSRVYVAARDTVLSKYASRLSMLIWPHMVAPGSAAPLLQHIIKKQYLGTLGNVQPCMEAAWGVEEPVTVVYIHRQVAQDL